MAKIAENVKFVDDLQQALRESLAVFPDSFTHSKLYEKSRTIWAYISSNV